MDAKALQPSFEPRLLTQRPRGAMRLELLVRGTTVGRQQVRLDAVSVKLPAGILADALQPNINEIALGYPWQTPR